MALIEPNPNRPFVNFDYTDFAEGTGIVVFYGAHSIEDTTVNYLLTRTTEFSNEIETLSGSFVTNNTWNMKLDLDFDLSPFNLPKNMAGTALINVPLKVKGTGGTPDVYVKARIRKYNSVAGETEIAVGQSETISGTNMIKKVLIKVIVPLTHFKKGDILRLTLEGWGHSDVGDTAAYMLIAHDPMARTTTDFPGTAAYKVTTQLKAQMPFRLGI